jgi:hypothetical protein
MWSPEATTAARRDGVVHDMCSKITRYDAVQKAKQTQLENASPRHHPLVDLAIAIARGTRQINAQR